MKNKTIVGLIIATSLVLVGSIIFTGVMMVFKWDFTKLSTVEYKTNSYDIAESFKNIRITTDTADVVFVKSKSVKVVCHEEKNTLHSVNVEDDTLVIEDIYNKEWYKNIGINFGTPKITVYIPEGEYGSLTLKTTTGDTDIPKDFTFEGIDISQNTGKVKCLASSGGDIKIKTSTGSIKVENITAGALDLKVSTGDINTLGVECVGDVLINVSTGKVKLENVKCNDIISSGNTGDITLNKVIANKKIDIERSTGDIKLEDVDATELIITTDTGDVKGTLLSDKVFVAKTDTGSVKVPETTSGGKCKITTDTGDIKIEIKK